MNNKAKKIYIGIGISALLLVGFIGFMYIQINNDEILKNTYIEGINIGKKDKENAKKIIEKKYDMSDFKILYKGKEWDIKTNDIDLSYNINKVINDAYQFNRKNSLIQNLLNTFKANVGVKNNLALEVEYNKQKLKNIINNIAKSVNIQEKDAILIVNRSSISVSEGNNGLKVNINDSTKNVISMLEKGNNKANLVVDKVSQNITKEQLSKVDALLGSYSTKFNSSIWGRSENIKLATDRTSDILLMPGETFSYNEHTGMRTKANGYKNAPVIVEGVVQEGIGGGVCQVSSTLYNAALYAGLEIVDIKNHSIPSTYVPKGRDATVTDSGIDFVFKNNLKHPIYIKNYVSSNIVTCMIYGNKSDKQNIQIQTTTDKVSVAPIKEVNDPTILKGKEKELESSRNGYTVSTYRIYSDNNLKTIKKEKVYTSYYPKKQGVVAIGTMGSELIKKENENTTEQPQKPVVPEQTKPQEPVTPEESKPQEPASDESKPQEPVIPDETKPQEPTMPDETKPQEPTVPEQNS